MVVLVVGVLVAGVLLVVGVAVELPDLPPQPATARVLARTAASVRIAVSGVLFIRMGRAPVVVCGLGRSPYQSPATPIAVGKAPVNAETTVTPEVAQSPSPARERAGLRVGAGCWPCAAWRSSWSSST